MDDIIIYGQNQEEHNKRLHTTLQCIESAGVTLNKDKCKFNCTSIKFLGHVVSADGFMGMVNQLGKFTADIAELSQPLRELLNKNCN